MGRKNLFPIHFLWLTLLHIKTYVKHPVGDFAKSKNTLSGAFCFCFKLLES